MNSGNLVHLFLCLCVLSTTTTKCEKKSKRDKTTLRKPPDYPVHPGSQLPHDKQVTVFARTRETKSYYYRSQTHGSLSLTIETCSSPIQWGVSHRRPNTSQVTGVILERSTTNGSDTFQWKADTGSYVLNVTSLEEDTRVNVYLSTEPGGPQALKSKQQVLKLVRRQRRKRLTVRWNPSLVDPQGTDYCLVVSTTKPFTSLCAAQSHRHGGLPHVTNQLHDQPHAHPWVGKTENFVSSHLDPMIACVGSRTHYTFGELQQGHGYHFNLFAINRQCNLTYPYGTAFTVFNKRVKPISLKDGRAAFVGLKKLDGKAVFRYKVPNHRANSSLELFVMPCGGAVHVEITLKGELIRSKRNIESFGKIVIQNLREHARYYIRIVSTNREELRKLSGVEVYASTKPLSNFPLPNVPNEPNVQEYTSLRGCDSVTVGWIPSPGQKIAHYCVVVREGRLRDVEGVRPPNQCGLESRMRKSADFFVQFCFDIKHERQLVLLRKISQLKAGKSYTVQVTVKKPKGKTLSYDLIQVKTLPMCDS